jgi:hypothetical protein
VLQGHGLGASLDATMMRASPTVQDRIRGTDSRPWVIEYRALRLPRDHGWSRQPRSPLLRLLGARPMRQQCRPRSATTTSVAWRSPTPAPLGPIPVRLLGAIAAPRTPGPHPLVLVLHGRHGDNCPVVDRFDGETWPCFPRERRNDLGLRHVVRAIAERGVVTLAPDLNGAFTGGWGESNDRRR